ncbi:hypothetical protein ScPMuIL_005143 [Solemya velum]
MAESESTARREEGTGSSKKEAGANLNVSAIPEEPTVETATEAKEPAPPDVIQLCSDTFQKTAEYMQGELEGTIEDYKLLEMMNKITITKYSEMKHIALNLGVALQDLNDKVNKTLQPYLDQIDQIEENVSSLEQAAYRLDAYSKRLEAKYKLLEKR